MPHLAGFGAILVRGDGVAAAELAERVRHGVLLRPGECGSTMSLPGRKTLAT
jgi:hypothetical protein